MIPESSILPNVPNKDLYLSRFHRVKINNKFVHALHTNVANFVVATSPVIYYNIETYDYENDVIIANGTEVETYFSNEDNKKFTYKCIKNKSCNLIF